VNGLEAIVAVVTPTRESQPRLRVHRFGGLAGLPAPRDGALTMELSFAAALALLEGRVHVPARRGLVRRAEGVKERVLGPTGMFAAKCATAGSLFGCARLLSPLSPPCLSSVRAG